MTRHVLPASGLSALLTRLGAGGRRVVGPTVRDGAIVLDTLRSVDDLPQGWAADEAPGSYRLRRRGDDAYFGYTVGPDAAKRFLHPPRQVLFRSRRTADGFTVEPPPPPAPVALIGLRACDLAAMDIQDRVLRDGPFADPHYAARRADVLLVAVQCVESGAACFCASMGAGPAVTGGFDLSLTELLEGAHRFVVEVGSPAGAALLEGLPLVDAGADAGAPERAASAAEAGQRRGVDAEGLRQRLVDAAEGPHWDAVAARCLGCAGCTMVCPTCFCTSVADVTDLTGEATRERRWESCLHLDFSYIHGGPVRPSLGARYRQWLTHKLQTWHDQFGTAGCVGCGRCTTWCPAGIDIVAEALAATAQETA